MTRTFLVTPSASHDVDDILVGLLGRTQEQVADLVAREITAYEPVGWRPSA